LEKLIADIKTWERRMRLREYFFDENDKDQDLEYSKLKKSSDWAPTPGRDCWLDLYVQVVRDDIIKGLRKDFKINITNQEEKALKELLYDESIVIRPSDKSSGIVILNRSEYENEVNNELKDNGRYKEIKEDKLKKKVESMYKGNLITKEMKGYLIPKGSRPGKFRVTQKCTKRIIFVESLLMAKNTR
jgi:hypothetical protein